MHSHNERALCLGVDDVAKLSEAWRAHRARSAQGRQGRIRHEAEPEREPNPQRPVPRRKRGTVHDRRLRRLRDGRDADLPGRRAGSPLCELGDQLARFSDHAGASQTDARSLDVTVSRLSASSVKPRHRCHFRSTASRVHPWSSCGSSVPEAVAGERARRRRCACSPAWGRHGDLWRAPDRLRARPLGWGHHSA